MASRIQVSWAELVLPAVDASVPAQAAAALGCSDAACGCAACCGAAAKPEPPAISSAPVRYATGEVVVLAEDIASSGFGLEWGHTRSFASRLERDTDLGNGYNWQVKEWSHLVFPDDTTAVVMGEANEALWFDRAGTTFTPRYGGTKTLLLDPRIACTSWSAWTGRWPSTRPSPARSRAARTRPATR